jgi:hypothetical protein
MAEESQHGDIDGDGTSFQYWLSRLTESQNHRDTSRSAPWTALGSAKSSRKRYREIEEVRRGQMREKDLRITSMTAAKKMNLKNHVTLSVQEQFWFFSSFTNGCTRSRDKAKESTCSMPRPSFYVLGIATISTSSIFGQAWRTVIWNLQVHAIRDLINKEHSRLKAKSSVLN